MTDFEKDVIYFTQMMACGDLKYFEVIEHSDHYAIETEDEIFRYDLITKERFF